MKSKIFSLLIIILTLSSCDDFLTRDPMDTVTDTPTFWNSEDNIRTSLYAFYDVYFEGYRTGWERSDWYSETNVADWTDDNAQKSATYFTKVAPAAETDVTSTKKDERNWTFSYVRQLNIIINRIGSSSLTSEAKYHWLGVARFLRAMEYSKLVSKFGDVPWYSNALENTDYESLYKEKDSRTLVMDSVLNDLTYACANIRKSDGTAGLTINKAVAYAFTSRLMLFEGTWQKYRANNNEYAIKYLQAAKNTANELLSWNDYSLADNYKSLTTSADLTNNKEIILYRSYVEGVITHSLMTFQVTEAEINSPSKGLIDSYLSANGLPINQAENALYKGDQWFFDEISNRDPRLYANIDTTGLKLDGVEKVYAISGYFGNRFVNESLKTSAGGTSNTCITDAPIMKLNEVMMNYIEATVELSQLGAYSLTQVDLDKTINTLRDRKSTKMPHLTLEGNNLSVNGITINDPLRDTDVPSLIWEIRRERRIELVYEGIRFNDLRRWNKLKYADMSLNPKLNLGAWLDKEKYIVWYNNKYKPSTPITLQTLKSINLDRNGNAGYIVPITDNNMLRKYQEKDYLYPIPLDQITLYETKGKELKQNTGW
ncbi:RagB/SusD family nutrient uptake outer membrane protein [Bacteroides graminisolvens]|uniref:RagB/SusD family nutrient uptake outer membrane protein n=1 Tax=Bacteroides graminisolvens TaxID=477666 RepID=UPI0023F55385|nr:RagB/SusD family nutrient uptake outer membrane protein [Bacteroides graminisolvens]